MSAGNTFNVHYTALLEELMTHGTVETNKRTNSKILLLEGGRSFSMDLHDGKLPVAGNRRYFPGVAAAETAWEFMGTRNPAFMLKHAPKLWESFVEADQIRASYGYRWRSNFGRDQLKLALKTLRNDPSNRQVYISAWDPAIDGLGEPGQPKNLPCPVGFSLTTSGNLLHLSVFMRSSDAFIGLPYDVMGYALKLAAFASSLDRVPGFLHFTMAHVHVYKAQWSLMKKSVMDAQTQCRPPMPNWSVDAIVRKPEQYVKDMKALAKLVSWNKWDPKPKVIV